MARELRLTQARVLAWGSGPAAAAQAPIQRQVL